jgi:hypothetical protein
VGQRWRSIASANPVAGVRRCCYYTEELSDYVREQIRENLSADYHARVLMDNLKISARYPWELFFVIGAAIFCGG